MAPYDRPCTTFYWSAIVCIPNLVPFSSYLVLNNIVTLKFGLEVTRGHLVPFKSLGAVSNSPSVVTMAIYCIICEI